jgi:hypothetical protein
LSANRLAALTGAAFVVLLIVGGAIAGEPPNPSDDSVQEIVDFYTDNESSIYIGTVLGVLAVTSLVFFGGYLRKVFQEAAGPGHILSSMVLVGASIIAVGFAIDATINITLTETVDDIEPGAVQALSALWNNDWVPIALGAFILILASGLSILRHGGLPRWLGWAALVLAVVMITPAGFIGFIGTGLWILVASIILTLREGKATA